MLPTTEKKDVGEEEEVEAIIEKIRPVDRAAIGFMCKDIIDMGRLMWLKEQRKGLLQAQLVKYVPSTSPENHLLIAKLSSPTHATIMRYICIFIHLLMKRCGG